MRRAPKGRDARFRTDIEGLRAVAVLLVVAFHAGIPAFGGGYVGVDVFFVISGFLITGLILRELESTGRLDLRRFYARRARRLLPAAAATLAGVAVLVRLVLPATRWSTEAGNILWSAVYSVNWRFAGQAVDYLQADAAPSAVQHFWSLAVEEQFYLLWPLLVAMAFVAGRLLRSPPRRVALWVIAAVSVLSLLQSIAATSTDPGRAYFATTTRVWELGAGAVLAIVAPRLRRLPRQLARLAVPAGLLAIAVAAVSFDRSTAFPGWAAIIPVAGTAAVIAAGTETNLRSHSILDARPMQLVGRLSYPIYLWHWPLLVAFGSLIGEAPWPVATAVGLSSLIPAWLTARLVEAPFRHRDSLVARPRLGLAFAAGCTSVGVVAALVLTAAIPPLTDVDPTSVQGPLALQSDEPPIQLTAAFVVPDPVGAAADLPAVYSDGCHQDQVEAAPLSCTYGRPESAVHVALVGDSHAAQWVPAFQRLADIHGWRLTTFTKSACQFADVLMAVGSTDAPYDSCVAWNDAVVDVLTGADAPDLVVTTGTHWPRLISNGNVISGSAGGAILEAGLERRWQQLLDAGIPVVAIRDVPYPRINVPECVSQHLDALTRCAVSRAEAMAGDGVQIEAGRATGVPVIDVTPSLCIADTCPAVIGDMLVWRDSHHLTATYAASLAPYIDRSLARLGLPAESSVVAALDAVTGRIPVVD